MFYENPYYLGKKTALGSNLKGRMVRVKGRGKKRISGKKLSAWRKTHLKGLHYKVKVRTYRKTRKNPMSLYDNPRVAQSALLYDNPGRRKAAKGKRRTAKKSASRSVSARLSRLEHSVKSIKKSQHSLMTRLAHIMGVKALPGGVRVTRF